MKAARDESRPDAARGRIRIKSCGLPIQVTSREVSTGESAAAVQATPQDDRRLPLPEVISLAASTRAVLAVAAPRRYRNREHLPYIAQQACFVCGRRQSDAHHHLRHVQPRALRRTASDEFAVPPVPLPSPIARRPRSDGRHDHRYASEDEADGRLDIKTSTILCVAV